MQLQLFETFAPLYDEIEQELQKGHLPIMLFKNITNRKELRDRTLRTTQATFITKLNAEAAEELRKLNPPTFSVSTNETVPLLLNLQLFPHLFLF